MTARFLGGLPGFLREHHPEDQCPRDIGAHLSLRTSAFLNVVREAVYANPASPYLPLLREARVEFHDIERLVARDGIEDALRTLHAAGVYVRLDEFKGRVPIRRGSVTLPASSAAFDNPLIAGDYRTRSGGSRSSGTPLVVALAMLEREACYESLTFRDFDLDGRPRGMWRPAPPGSAGLRVALRFARARRPIHRWFSQNRVGSIREWRHLLFTTSLVTTSRLAGRPIAAPEHVPISRADVIVDWLSGCKARGRAALFETNAASAVRICSLAMERRVDISETFFRVGGEPYSPGKARVIADAGCRAAAHYAMAEGGRLGNACADPEALDDVHVAMDKLMVLTRDVDINGVQVPGIFMTTLAASASKIMLNTELGDYAVRTSRTCGCSLGALGFTEHLHSIRSYEKLTSEGMHFVGADLITLIEQILPATFGGDPTSYQFVEEEEDGLPRVSLLISPRVGDVDVVAARAVVLAALGGRDAAQKMMAARWREAETMRVVRREPASTLAGKTLALHVIKTPGRATWPPRP